MFGGLEHQKRNFGCYIYIYYVAPPYSAGISAIYFHLATFGWVRFAVCNQNVATKQNAEFTKGW